MTNLDVSDNDNLQVWDWDKTVVVTGTEEKNKEDIVGLKQIIAGQKELGAHLSDSIDSYDYRWTVKGRLIGIFWENDTSLKGDISFSSLSALKYLYCEGNRLSSLDISGCTNLKKLTCQHNDLTNIDISDCSNLTYLDVSKCINLIGLECWDNQLISLDLRNNMYLTNLA